MLTPQEVSEHAFAKASFGGYNMAMVDEFLDVLTADYTTLYKENATLKAKMKVLVDKVEEYRSTEEAMRKALLTAQKMADELVAQAEAKKAELLKNAETEAKARIAELQQDIRSEQMRLTAAQNATAAYVGKLKELYQHEMDYLNGLSKLSAPAEPEPEGEAAPWRIAGEVLNTYIIVEQGDKVLFIDKHAAHERMNFDKLKNAQEPPMRQTLLAPIAAELSREDGALLLENLPLLEQFGFACEDFGAGALLVREVPADIDAADTVPTLEEFAERLRTGRSPDEKREALLHTMACKAAIKGGWVSDPAELRVLVDRVQSGEIKYCPHGRPVAVKLTKYELEKMFKRA